MLQLYAAIHNLEIDCVGILRGKRRLIDQLEYTGCTGQGILQLGHNTGNLIERLGIMVRVA